MKQYKIVTGNTAAELETEVAKLLNEGWKLLGGVAMAYKHEHGGREHIPGHLAYAQAMEKN